MCWLKGRKERREVGSIFLVEGKEGGREYISSRWRRDEGMEGWRESTVYSV